jgi:hypothetical protein
MLIALCLVSVLSCTCLGYALHLRARNRQLHHELTLATHRERGHIQRVEESAVKLTALWSLYQKLANTQSAIPSVSELLAMRAKQFRSVVRRPVDGRAAQGPPKQLPPVERPNADAQQALKARLQAKHGASNGNGSAAPVTAPAAPEQRLSRGQRRRLRNQQATAAVVANVTAIDQRPPEVIRLAARYAKTP